MHNAIFKLPGDAANVLVFNTLTGLLPTEAVLSIKLIKSEPEIYVNEETRMLEHLRYPHAPTQWTLMFVNEVYPGWVPFNGLGGAENVSGFIETADMMINNYDFNKFEAGHLTRLGIVDDTRTDQEFIQDLHTISQQVRSSKC